MTPYTYKAPDIRPGIVKVGAYDVLIRPHPGVATPPWIWDVLDVDESTGLRVVVASYCSYPNEDNCATAVSNYRAKRSVAKLIDEATAHAQHDLHRYAGRVATDGSVRQVRNGRDVVRKGKTTKPHLPATPEREVGEVATATSDAPEARGERGSRRVWTPAEDEALLRHYRSANVEGVKALMPRITRRDILDRLREMGALRRRGQRPVVD